VADQKHRAFVVLQQVFQQLQRVDVQVVGWLVEHQHVGGPCKQARQQQAVALAARQRAHWRVGACGRKQKVGQIAFDVFFLAVDLDPFAARADEVLERGVQVQRVAHLVKVRHLQIRAEANFARWPRHVGLQFAQNELE